MNIILHIETSTRVCSVGVSVNGTLKYVKEENTLNYSHSSVLTSFIEQALRESGHDIKDLSAVAVSMGPGSYTGLRIGVSAAKGLCYALDIPMMAVDTLHALASHGKEKLLEDNSKQHLVHSNTIYCPMIDARRMEVYINMFDNQLNPLSKTEAKIIEKDTFCNIGDDKTLILFGDGALKCMDVIIRSNTVFMPDILPSAQGMADLAVKQYEQKDFVDVAYFEPFYLKDFVAGAPNVKGLYR